ncbi:MAG: DEAD/DEAH box helicase [Bacillaceae bacterium]
MKTFTELGLSKAWGKALFKQGITEPTPIQENVIPCFLHGKDIFAQAQTGSGKTFAFLLPMLQKINREQKHLQGLIVTPTRELALQISQEIEKMIMNVPEITSLAIYGGQDVTKQVKKSKGGAQLIIATPGRLLDHLRRETIDLSTVNMFVLDEGDEMLRMGFLPDVQLIIEKLKSDIQICIFSATLNDEVRSLASTFAKDPIDIRIEPKQKVVKTVNQRLIETTDRRKCDTLCELLNQENPFMAIIFCRTKVRVQKLVEQLKQRKYNVAELHGDLSQGKRERVMKQFRETKIQYLVATDVAARGVDIEGVTHVFNYDIPHDVDTYIHRIGRTGRAGQEGIAITLFAPKDVEYVELLKKEIKFQ